MNDRVKSWASTVLVLGAIVLAGSTSHQQSVLADRGAEAHVFNCALKDDLRQRVANAEEFLSLTLEERIEKYGRALGTIDPGYIRSNLVNQKRTLALAEVLDCS